MRYERESEYTRADIQNMCDHPHLRSTFHTYTDVCSYYCPVCKKVFDEHPSGFNVDEGEE